jgi:small subunit ribosomal protein S4
MARYLGPKCRLCRREKTKLFLKGDRCNSPACPLDRRGAVPPGQHGLKTSRSRVSEYGRQLREKQKLKRTYGLLEKQLHHFFKKAQKSKKAAGEVLLQMLESRLDNIVFKLKFAPSRAFARQLISHKHILVEGKKINIPSFMVKPGEIISLDEKALKIEEVKKSLQAKEKLPAWLKKKAAVGQMVRLPERKEIEGDINEQLIVEYYSR